MTKEEVEEAENTPLEGDEKADDDEMKDAEPSTDVKMETDEVNVDDKFEEVHRDLGSFSFNEDEVDYDDNDEEEEEEMEVEEEEEAEEPKMSPNDENIDDDRVVGDDDDRLREEAEERVRAQQEQSNRFPKWAQPLEIGIKKMPEAYEGVNNIDPDEVSPQIFDNNLMVYIAGYYDAYYKYRTEVDAKTRYEWTTKQTDRLDIDKLGPMNGFEDDGIGIYYMVRKRYRNLDVAIIAAQCGVRLPKVLQRQVDYAWAKAMADMERGKAQRLQTLMPSAPERVHDVATIVDETSTSYVQGTRAAQPGSQAASSSSKGPAKGKEKGKDKGKGKDDKGKGKDKNTPVERRTLDKYGQKRPRY
eukprot:s6047_g1.t1